jgi:hypothetical protein
MTSLPVVKNKNKGDQLRKKSFSSFLKQVQTPKKIFPFTKCLGVKNGLCR